MSEEEFFNRLINKIDKEFGYDVANTLQLMFIKKEKQVEQLDKEIERLKNIISELEKWIEEHKQYQLISERYIVWEDKLVNKLKALKENK